MIKYIIYFILAVIVTYMLIVALLASPERLKKHNAYQCAVYGKEPDCKTELPPERRLK